MLLSNLSKIKASYKNRSTKYSVVLKCSLSVYIILLIVNQLCNLYCRHSNNKAFVSSVMSQHRGLCWFILILYKSTNVVNLWIACSCSKNYLTMRPRWGLVLSSVILLLPLLVRKTFYGITFIRYFQSQQSHRLEGYIIYMQVRDFVQNHANCATNASIVRPQ
jgi:hypothetical protein